MKRDVEMVGRFERHRLPDASEVYFDPEPHAYYSQVKPSPKAKGGYSAVKDSRLTGVSTVSKALDTNMDPLLWWAARLDQTGIAELASVELDNGGDLEWLREQRTIDQALREAKRTWRDVRDAAATRGTNVHELIFLALAQDERPPSLAKLSDEERGYGQAAIKWWRERKPTPLYAEQVTRYKIGEVAGRFDLLCVIDGKRVLADAKTRDRGAVRRSDHVQLAGYELCNRSCGLGESDRRLALILTPWGEYREFDGLCDEHDFLAALNAYRCGSGLEKRMRAVEAEMKVAA